LCALPGALHHLLGRALHCRSFDPNTGIHSQPQENTQQKRNSKGKNC
jgi:hypothetical protein